MHRTTHFKKTQSPPPPRNDLFISEYSKPKLDFIEKKYQAWLPKIKDAVKEIHLAIDNERHPAQSFQKLKFLVLDYDTRLLGNSIGTTLLQDMLKMLEVEVKKLLQYKENAHKQWQALNASEAQFLQTRRAEYSANKRKSREPDEDRSDLSSGEEDNEALDSDEDNSDLESYEKNPFNLQRMKLRSEHAEKNYHLSCIINTALDTFDQATADNKSNIVAQAYKLQLSLQKSINASGAAVSPALLDRKVKIHSI